MTSKPVSVAAIGECMLELSKRGDSWKMGHAGDTFNVSWVLRALLPDDAVTDFLSAFGTDPFSVQQVDFMASNGIGIGQSPRLAGAHPGIYAITLDGAERSFTYWRQDSAARRLASNPQSLAQSLAGRDLIYFSGITLAILDRIARQALLQEIRQARLAGAKVAFDPNYRPHLWPGTGEAAKAIGDALAHVDIALPTFSDERALFGDEDPEATARRIASAGVAEIVVKNGAEDALLWTPQKMQRLPAVRVDVPVDTTGAGDAFNGGYLAARMSGRSPFASGEQAHRIAAITVQEYGALAPMDRLRAGAASETPLVYGN